MPLESTSESWNGKAGHLRHRHWTFSIVAWVGVVVVQRLLLWICSERLLGVLLKHAVIKRMK